MSDRCEFSDPAGGDLLGPRDDALVWRSIVIAIHDLPYERKFIYPLVECALLQLISSGLETHKEPSA